MYVNFTNFAESSLTLLVSVFTNTIDYIRYLEIKQDVLLKIAKIITAIILILIIILAVGLIASNN